MKTREFSPRFLVYTVQDSVDFVRITNEEVHIYCEREQDEEETELCFDPISIPLIEEGQEHCQSYE